MYGGVRGGVEVGVCGLMGVYSGVSIWAPVNTHIHIWTYRHKDTYHDVLAPVESA
jgi:hypothetical protein